ncbi:MAG: TIGR00269 family protein [Thermoplasmata archaeon]
MRCSACTAPAVVDQPYRGGHACAEHLSSSVEDRFRREMRRQLPRFRDGTIAVAVSGGKDSAVALALTHRFFSSRPDVRIVAISVDEGIPSYRPRTLRAAEELVRSLGVEHRIVRAEDDLGTTTDRAARELPGTPPCSFCGVWRRSLLNSAARSLAARALVLGFNLDDLAQTVLMNVARGDVGRLVRMAPHRGRQPGLVPRLAPLAQVPEREVFLYAQLRALPFDHAECPHAVRAARNRFREVVWQLEEDHPGTRQALLRSQERLAELLGGEAAAAPSRCRSCGDPASGPLCRSCEFHQLAVPTPEAM